MIRTTGDSVFPVDRRVLTAELRTTHGIDRIRITAGR